MNALLSRSRQRGQALTLLLHVLLLLLVMGQVVYLASRHRARVDLTSDQLWSSTDSTRTLLDKLDKRLVVEAYFSPKEKLPVLYRETRAWADSFLDELVQLGKGKVVLQRFDPNADKAITDRANRIGVKPLQLQSSSTTSMSVDLHWQGVRLVYGGGKQKVLAQFTPTSSFVAEAIVTPAIKEVATEQKRKFGFMEWPATAVGSQQPGGIGWNALRTHEGLSKRYEFQNFKDEDGALLPADLDTLFLFRPKDLTDRQKYVLDQFVVRGGTLVVFADACEYAIGPQRLFRSIPMQLDATGSKHQLLAQLLHYGVDWKPKVLADLAQRAHVPLNPRESFEYLAVAQVNAIGQQVLAGRPYPYFFHALAYDWRDAADDLARDDKQQVDREAADSYRKRFGPGMPSDEFLFKSFKQVGRGPGFYWPTWVGLREKAGGALDLPEGVTGRVHLWSSPAMLVEDPPQSLNPLGTGTAVQQQVELNSFLTKLKDRLRAEPRQQAPLMCEVRGRFSSFFTGQDRPQRPSEIKENEAKQAASAAKVDDPNTDIDESKGNPDDGPQPGQEPKGEAEGALATPEPAMLTNGDKPGRIVMIGDSDFVRDDFVSQTYVQAGGPFSARLAGPFFAQLLDWLVEDRDLMELQSRSTIDRTLKFVDDTGVAGADPRLAEQNLRSKVSWLRGLNIVLPAGLLVALGLSVFTIRRAQKRAFLASLS